MMDDLLSLDFNFLDDDDLLSFPLGDDFNPIESREIESILNELENSANDKIISDLNSFCQIKPTISIFKSGKTNKKSKNKIGTSLLARPPKKLKKDKNSILLMNKPNSTNSLLSSKPPNQISQAKFSNYFYSEHDYCIKPFKRSFNETEFVDLNNNFKLDEDNITIELTKEEIIVTSNPDDELLKKKNQPFNLITSNMFNNSYDKVHDLDDFFNISFTNSEETNSDSLSSNHSESEDENTQSSDQQENETCEKVTESKKDESTDSKPVECIAKAESNEETMPETCKDAELKEAEKIAETSPLIKKEVKNIIIDDINDYNIDEINDTDNDELNSLDEDDEEDDILIETDILIDEIDDMFGDFEEYDLISSSKRLRISKNAPSKKNNRNVNSKSSKQISNQRDRRSRTISNSYSVRSGSSCSCCSDELSEEELLKRPLNEQQSKHHQQKPSNKPANRRSISKLIKADNTFIRKKNTGRFINRIKNTSF